MPSTSAYSSPSPSESSSSSATVRPTSTRDDASVMEPPRKRARSDLSTEQRREARAHRNRIAAQNSRDKRKAHFVYLEKRVAELEEENQRLRAEMGLSQFIAADTNTVSPEGELVQARENRELKERIKSLESGWSAVIKALQASGLPLNIQLSPSTSTDCPLPTPTSSAGPLPTTVSSSPAVYPLSPATSTSSFSSSQIFEEFESTRHLARVATVESAGGLATNHHTVELDIIPSSSATTTTDNSISEPVSDDAMEELLREIIASPSSPTTSLPFEIFSPDLQATDVQLATPFSAAVMPGSALDGEDLQRLLNMIPDVQPNQERFESSPSLDFPLAGWDLAASVF
ncbi:hypothetical protein BDM02DRAFT_3185023 [Thelephora ganbajun]|uniref:Uncharacterized protein n=1 Tax=Thelephora ganbajun TaxID=370292 RepID=A0ACB6ZNZ9_THEGA|nr:hypothetical protein BDM02DRAFT_3185023 [Thelephora ganbajun]